MPNYRAQGVQTVVGDVERDEDDYRVSLRVLPGYVGGSWDYAQPYDPGWTREKVEKDVYYRLFGEENQDAIAWGDEHVDIEWEDEGSQVSRLKNACLVVPNPSNTQDITYRDVIYTTEHGDDHHAVGVTWKDLEAYLGHPPKGSPQEDAQVAKALVRAGAPGWVRDAEGALDEDGWYLLGPTVG